VIDNKPAPQSDFYKGMSYAIHGFSDMLQPGIKRYVCLPFLINLIVFGAIFFFGSDYIVHKLDFQFLHTLPKWLEWLSWVVSALKAVMVVVLIMLLFVGCAILSTFCANLIGAPFNGFLSDAFTASHGKSAPSRSIVKTVTATLSREGQKYLYIIPRAIGVGVIAAILFFIPGLNLALPVIFYWFTAFMMSIEYVDYPADSQHIPFKELLKIRKQRRWLHLGFGITIAVLSSVPFLNLLVMPAAVVGATRLWHENH
jgi:CysZ protein